MYYIGVDYHKRYSYILVKDRDGKVEFTATTSPEAASLKGTKTGCL